MNNKLRKGFTIVELVIVIAVIAILAGVLIPTFSSITKNAKQSAAMQQARNGMEATLALTGGSYPTGTDFLVGTKDGVDYWFSYEGNTLKDVTGTDSAVVGQYGADYYAAYFSSKCFNEAVSDKDSGSKNYDVSLGILLDALGLSGGSTVASFTTVPQGYVTLTYTQGNAVSIRVYYTVDIEPTLVVLLAPNA